MATYKILYWQQIPSQVKADDGEDEVTLPMPSKFMERIDYLAMHSGMAQTDDYLAQWQWSEEAERPGTAREVAEAVAAELAASVSW
jgi:Virulence factor